MLNSERRVHAAEPAGASEREDSRHRPVRATIRSANTIGNHHDSPFTLEVRHRSARRARDHRIRGVNLRSPGSTSVDPLDDVALRSQVDGVVGAGNVGGGGIAGPADPSVVFSALPGPVVAALVGLCYLGLAQYVIWLNDPVNAGAGYWPAAGVSLVALLFLPVRRWGWVIGAIIAAEIGGDALHGYPLAASSWWALGNVAEPVVAALLLRRFGRSGRLTPFGALVPFLVAGVVVGPFVGAAIGSVGTSSVYGTPQLDVFVKWWVGDGLGVLVVAPLLLCVREPSIAGRSRSEAAGTLIAISALTVVAFTNWPHDWDVVLPFLIVPALMVASVRHGVRGAAVAGFMVAEIAILATALDYGSFNAFESFTLHAVTALQVFLVSALITALVVAALTHDALDAATQHERQRSVADAFQVAALPERLPRVPGLSIAAGYDAASSDGALRVGGDWFDVFALPNGSTAFVIGDVAGHDLAAAVLMTTVRHTFRSLLSELHEPDTTMTAIDQQLATSKNLILVTAIVAVYNDGELTWTNAGHPPPIISPRDAPARYITHAPDMILGIGEGHYTTHRAALNVGDVVVAYTDGVIEERNRTIDNGLARLTQLVSNDTTRDPQVICDLLLEEGLDKAHREDDACTVVIKRTE